MSGRTTTRGAAESGGRSPLHPESRGHTTPGGAGRTQERGLGPTLASEACARTLPAASPCPTPEGDHPKVKGRSTKRWEQMTPEEQYELCREHAYAEAREQGLPEVCDDPALYAELGRIFATCERRLELERRAS